MVKNSKTECIGILTAGGDCPGLNAAIRAVAKAAINEYGMTVVGFNDGFRGLVENRTVQIDNKKVSGILTQGGTLLGTSRDKLHKMPMGGKTIDMTKVAVENLERNHIDCLVCLGGGGTQKNALRLHKEGGVNVMTLPKTIDNDVSGTDVTFGFDTALQIATDAIDRLHTTATSHHRIIVCEIMGHNTGWLTMSAGIAGGADVILIPELPYDVNVISEYLLERRRKGSRFSIVAVAEGAISKEDMEKSDKSDKKKKKKKSAKSKEGKIESLSQLDDIETDRYQGQPLVERRIDGTNYTYHIVQESIASRLARQLQSLTGMEARITSLGHVQRGGIPTAFDRWLCTRLGTKAALLLSKGVYNVMIGYDSGHCIPVPLEDVAGKRKSVPEDHPMIASARLVGTCLGQ